MTNHIALTLALGMLIDIPGAKVVKTIDLGEHRRPHGMV